MAVSWTKEAKQFKSSLTVTAGFLLRSRETQARRAKARTQQVSELKKELAKKDRRIRELEEQAAEQRAEIARLRIENERLRDRPPRLPDDPPLPHHEFGSKIIALCVNLARRIGFRAVPDVLRILFASLGVEARVPDWTAVRLWTLRSGLAALQEPVEEASDWVWLVDHTNQIGQEKALSVIGVRASKLPCPGQALRYEDVRVLELKPGKGWNREEMSRAYAEMAERCGAPLALVSDGAPELREGAAQCEALRREGEKPLILGDFKHYASNVLKRVVGGEERFGEFQSLLARTRSAIQQTELAPFCPPKSKPKARFMNLAPMLRWAEMVLWHLSHEESAARQGIASERMEEKLGWLRAFREDIRRWSACQSIVSAACTFINEQGVFRGAAQQLRRHLARVRPDAAGPDACGPARSKESQPWREVMACLLRFVRQSESQLREGQRLPLSTEILESSFGLFKQLEAQHSKGGFTSLLAAYGCLLKPATPESIREQFQRVTVKDVKAWVAENLGQTVTSKRKLAYQEHKHATAEPQAPAA